VRELRESHVENEASWKERVGEIEARAAKRGGEGGRPFLFEQVSLDTKVLREKQRAYDKFDEVMRKKGLTELLDIEPPPA
tara:strand:- start:49 stop:288 length:240 start_codon:yes stop_codon:yes gene_type:complete